MANVFTTTVHGLVKKIQTTIKVPEKNGEAYSSVDIPIHFTKTTQDGIIELPNVDNVFAYLIFRDMRFNELLDRRSQVKIFTEKEAPSQPSTPGVTELMKAPKYYDIEIPFTIVSKRHDLLWNIQESIIEMLLVDCSFKPMGSDNANLEYYIKNDISFDDTSLPNISDLHTANSVFTIEQVAVFKVPESEGVFIIDIDDASDMEINETL